VNSRNQNQKELWFYNGREGSETIRNLDGSEIVSKWFVSGPAVGRIRSITVKSSNLDGKYISKNYSYNDKGELIRKIVSGESISSTLYNNWNVSELKKGNHSILRVSRENEQSN